MTLKEISAPPAYAPPAIHKSPLVEHIPDMRQRISRHMGLMVSIFRDEPAVSLFHSHLYGLDSLRGKRVLEIGGHGTSLERYLVRGGSEYLNVRLEEGLPLERRVVAADYMDISGSFDLVISLGVFEDGGIDRNRVTHLPLSVSRTTEERARKLSELTADTCVIGTISARCFFSDATIEAAGFRVAHRSGPFYSFMRIMPGYGPRDPSELLVLQKKS